jgi:hypothetical protein
MTTIDFTNEQVEELISFYKLELEKNIKRVIEIKGILAMLESTPKQSNKQVVQEIKPKKKIAETASVESNKNIKWSDSIIELLKEKQKPLPLKEIIKTLAIQKNIPKSDLKKTNYAIQQSIYRLRTINNKIQSTKIAGKKEKLFSLTELSKNTNTEQIIEKQKPIAKPKIKPADTPQVKGKYNWQGFIKDTLENKKRVLNLSEFVNVALKHFELKNSEKSRTKANLAPVLTKLVRKDKTLKTTLQRGKNGRSYGLKAWFDESGNLVSLYK